MVTQRVLELLRLRRSWFAVGALSILALLAWVAQTYRPAAAQAEVVVKTYPCPDGQAATIADHLRQELSAVDGVRVAVDSRASQVVVQAPQEVQVWVAQRLGVNADLATASDAPSASGNATQTRTITLGRSQPNQIATALEDILGDRLTTLSLPRESPRKYHLAADGGTLELTVDSAASQVKLSGTPAAVDSTARLVQILDGPQESAHNVRLLPLRTAHLDDIQRATAAIMAVSTTASRTPATLAYYQAKPGEAGTSRPAAVAPGAAPGSGIPPIVPSIPGAPGEGGAGGLINPVTIEMIPGLEILVIRGNPQDIKQVAEIIRRVEALSELTKPEIRVIPLKEVDCEALAVLLTNLYNEVYRPRQGAVSITPVITPNELLVVGRPENVKTVADLAERLDKPTIPDAQFRVFQLRYAEAPNVQAALASIFPDRGQLGPVVRVTVDPRSNAVIIQASPRDMLQAADVINRLDTTEGSSVKEVRIIRLEHATASDVAAIMASAINAATGGATVAGAAGAGGAQATGGTTSQRAEMLRLFDVKGHRLLKSGLLSGVKISTDPRANSLIVTARGEDMDLIETLIRQIDMIPAQEAQIKVFKIFNGDAQSLVTTLQQLFGLPTTTTGGGGALRKPSRPPRPAARPRSSRCGSPSTCGPTASSPRARWAISTWSRRSSPTSTTPRCGSGGPSSSG